MAADALPVDDEEVGTLCDDLLALGLGPLDDDCRRLGEPLGQLFLPGQQHVVGSHDQCRANILTGQLQLAEGRDGLDRLTSSHVIAENPTPGEL